jgi:hypothetical protein
MKTTFKTLVLILTVLMFSTVNVLNANPLRIENEQYNNATCGVTDAQIIHYMAENGYNVITIHQITGSCNVITSTQGGKRFIIIINNGQIVDYEEVLS